MERNVWVISLIVGQVFFNQILAAPNCDLRSVFRTPRDFDQFELIERSSFDPTRDKTNADHLKEDSKPYANAQVLLRINCDNENAKNSEEPCAPISRIGNTAQKVVERKVAVPQYNPMLYQQYSHPYHLQAPYVYPNCLYYDALGALCSHLMPVVREVFRAKQTGRKCSQKKADCIDSSEEQDALTFIDDTPSKVGLKKSRRNDDFQSFESSEDDDEINIRPEIHGFADLKSVEENYEAKKIKHANTKDKNEKHEKKKVKKDKDKHKDKGNSKHRESNIQKIPEDGKVDLSLLMKDNQNGKLLSLNAMKLQESRLSVERDARDTKVQEESLRKVESTEIPSQADCDNCEVSLHLLKLTKSNETDKVESAANVTNIAQILNEALIPIACLGCEERMKNVITYPIFNKNMLENDRVDISVENCGCLNSLDEGSPKAKHHKFSFDMDDLNLMHGKPVTQSSIIRNMAPKFLKDIITEKSLSQYVPVLREDPKLSIVTYEQDPQICQSCHRKDCICHLLGKKVYEEEPQIVYVEPQYDEQVVTILPSAVESTIPRPLPSYLSRQLSRPLPIYEQATEEDSGDILVPVTIVTNDESVSDRCPTCAPYAGELNEP